MATAYYNTVEYDNFKLKVINALASLDWEDKEFLSTACAVKSYDSIVGPKEATIMLEQYDADHWVLKGLFETMGENALRSTKGLLRKDLADEDIQLGVSGFVGIVEHTIAQTKMVRLNN